MFLKISVKKNRAAPTPQTTFSPRISLWKPKSLILSRSKQNAIFNGHRHLQLLFRNQSLDVDCHFLVTRYCSGQINSGKVPVGKSCHPCQRWPYFLLKNGFYVLQNELFPISGAWRVIYLFTGPGLLLAVNRTVWLFREFLPTSRNHNYFLPALGISHESGLNKPVSIDEFTYDGEIPLFITHKICDTNEDCVVVKSYDMSLANLTNLAGVRGCGWWHVFRELRCESNRCNADNLAKNELRKINACKS